jgi:hypothetical protein
VLLGEGRIALVLEERVDRENGLVPANVLRLHRAIKFGCGYEISEKALLDLLAERSRRGKGSKTETIPRYEGLRRCTNLLVSARAHAEGEGFSCRVDEPRGRGGEGSVAL